MNNPVEVHLYNQNLLYIPKYIFAYSQTLQVLGLAQNRIRKIPPAIGNLTNLVTLNLYDNEIAVLPKEIGNLVNLEELNLEDNMLKTLPDEIGNLRSLENLYLTGNNISKLPKGFENLPDNIVITYGREYTKRGFMRLFTKKIVNGNTNFINKSFYPTNKENIPINKRAYLNIPQNVRNNGRLIRVYNSNGLKASLNHKPNRIGRGFGGTEYTNNNIKLLKNNAINNIKRKLISTDYNKLKNTINTIKNRLPEGVSRTDINTVVSNIKYDILEKIDTQLRNTSSKNFQRAITSVRTNKPPGVTNDDIKKILRNIRKDTINYVVSRFKNAEVANLKTTFKNIKNENIHVSPQMVREITPMVLQIMKRKIRNHIRNTNNNNRQRVINNLKRNLPPGISASELNNLIRNII